MFVSTFQDYVRSILEHIPYTHWAVMTGFALALTIILQAKEKWSDYSAIAMGITVFVGLLLLDTTVVGRLLGYLHYDSGLHFSFYTLFHFPKIRRVEFFANFCIFIPFGFFLAESLSMSKRFSVWRRYGLATLVAFGLSLCIECLQWILHVGIFELADLVLNTTGGFIGASLATIERVALDRSQKRRSNA